MSASERPGRGEASREEGTGPEVPRGEIPPASFPEIVLLLAHLAGEYLRRLEKPETKGNPEIARLAQHHVDLLQILDERTHGNLSEEERRLLESLLMDLRLQYVRLAGPEA